MDVEHDAGHDAALPSPRYRDHSKSGTRKQRGILRFSDAEWAPIVAVSAKDGWVPQAWAQQVAFAVASRRLARAAGSGAGVDEHLESLRGARRLLTVIGGDIHDIAREANARGELPSEAALVEMLAILGQRVQSLDTCIAALRPGLMP
ncbi:hypothetical protein ACIRG5_45570 [Lentzea sp. NPDC102401]|uniref:hypothetical protein n=1 Tax=Lentzea sp. NPDC102401 TaxID=3364128 RepID=UPI0038273453